MTKEELVALIKAKVANQGNQLDAGGVVANILLEIVGASVPVRTESIENLDAAVLEPLKAGNVVVKVDGSGEHAYVVSYRGEGGLCLTYADCENVETLAYTRTGEGVWSFDDKTVTHIGA